MRPLAVVPATAVKGVAGNIYSNGGVLMTERHIDPSTTVTSQRVDDLKLIKGIGPAIEHRLNTAGIYTYSQLAAMSPNELALLFTNLTGLSAERIAQKDWIGQALQLVTESEDAEITQAVPDSHQHYSVFTVELLLDENNNVRRTSVIHVQSQVKSAWAGWEEGRLLYFINQSAALHLPRYEEKQVAEVTMPASIQPLPLSAAETISSISKPGIRGGMQLIDMEIKTAETEGSQHLIRSNQPFRAELVLDLAYVPIPQNSSIRYSASIIAKKKGSGKRQQFVGKAEGEFLPADRVTVVLDDLTLPSGLYRMEAFVKLTPPWQSAKPEAGLMAMKEGSLLQVY
jgi:predicted flap endonuclease-1-like 5' DNA nuclease